MPIYEYLCGSCGRVSEALQRLSEPPLEDCPFCEDGGLSRILSAHNVGGVASGSEAASCERSPEPFCGGCDMAGTGCS
jgi:putative FmdB family regulatory protein